MSFQLLRVIIYICIYMQYIYDDIYKYSYDEVVNRKVFEEGIDIENGGYISNKSIIL